MPPSAFLPGRVADPGQADSLKQLVKKLCGVENTRFPGSQPVSFKKTDIQRLQQEDYWVCEKSDGIRLLLLIIPFPNGQEVFIIDRKNEYRQLTGLYFPHYIDKQRPLGHSLIDGELVVDVDPVNKTETPRFLAFDCLVSDGQPVLEKPLPKRYGRLRDHIIAPHAIMIKEFPDHAANRPFDVQIKKMELAYSVEKVVRNDIPLLHHGSDGLVYTCAETGYAIGTDPRLLKWKAPSENSVDFKLEVRFQAQPERPNDPDYSSKPTFILNAFHGEDRYRREPRYEFFDIMDVDTSEWEKMKSSGDQYDDRIVEVAWDIPRKSWRFLRFRDDKQDGNHISVVHNIIESIRDGVEVEELLSSAGIVKREFKAREQARNLSQRQAPAFQQPLPPHPPPPSRPPPPTTDGPRQYSRASGPLTIGGFSR